MIENTYDRLAVQIHPDRVAAGRASAAAAATLIAGACAERGEARVIFACAPSQNEFLAALVDPAQCGRAIDWSKVTAFHMDEYVGLTASMPESFRHYLQHHLLGLLPQPPLFHPICAESPSLAEECDRYARLLAERPVDLVCLGIGENGHLAFNDPPVADFADPQMIKVVTLDEACRQQQVNDGCFGSLEAVPRQALTLTIPALLAARHLSCVVPGPRKAAAVRASLLGSVETACPASILRRQAGATLYLDTASASLLPS